MNKTKILLSLFFIVLWYAGCKKEKDINDNLTCSEGNANAQRIAPEDMESAMNGFIYHVWPNGLGELNETPGDLDNDFEAEDALLIVEAALNYGTCFPDSDYDEIAADTLSFEMDLTRNNESGEFMLSGSDIIDFSILLLDSALHAKNRVTFGDPDDPFNIVVDLEFSEFDRESQASTQTAVVRVITWVGNVAIGASCSWGGNDYWWAMGPFTGYGCGSNSSNTSSWATRELDRRLSPLCRGMCAGTYYSDISTNWFSPYNNNTGCGNAPTTCYYYNWPPYNSYLWAANGDECLSPAHLACEVTGIKYLAACYSGGKSIISYKMMVAPCSGPPTWCYHHCTVKYGICHDID